jgi:hypothetical protein
MGYRGTGYRVWGKEKNFAFLLADKKYSLSLLPIIITL